MITNIFIPDRNHESTLGEVRRESHRAIYNIKELQSAWRGRGRAPYVTHWTVPLLRAVIRRHISTTTVPMAQESCKTHVNRPISTKIRWLPHAGWFCFKNRREWNSHSIDKRARMPSQHNNAQNHGHIMCSMSVLSEVWGVGWDEAWDTVSVFSIHCVWHQVTTRRQVSQPRNEHELACRAPECHWPSEAVTAELRVTSLYAYAQDYFTYCGLSRSFHCRSKIDCYQIC